MDVTLVQLMCHAQSTEEIVSLFAISINCIPSPTPS